MNKKPKYFIVFGIIFFLLLEVSFDGIQNFSSLRESLLGWRDLKLISILCFVCGVQNAAITIVSKSIIRTTHLTGITTDLGVGLVKIFFRSKIKDLDPNLFKVNLIRVGLIYFFTFGVIVSSLLFRDFGHKTFFLPTAISGLLFFLMLYFQVFKKQRNL